MHFLGKTILATIPFSAHLLLHLLILSPKPKVATLRTTSRFQPPLSPRPLSSPYFTQCLENLLSSSSLEAGGVVGKEKAEKVVFCRSRSARREADGCAQKLDSFVQRLRRRRRRRSIAYVYHDFQLPNRKTRERISLSHRIVG